MTIKHLSALGGAAMTAALAFAQPVYVRPTPWFNPNGQSTAPFSNIRAAICGSFQSPIDMRLNPGTYYESISISAPGTYTAPNGPATIDSGVVSTTDFRIVSYNVRLWPGFFVSLTLSDQDRAEWIGPRLSTENADVVAMQESWDYKLDSFDASSRNDALRGNYTFQYYGSQFYSGDNVNCGLLTQSIHPLFGGTQFKYTECDGNDCQASKGYTRVLLNKGGFNIAVYNTHTQAGNDASNPATRLSQITELANDVVIFRSLNPTYAVFVAGDFNIDGYTSEFSGNMSLALGGIAGLADGALNEQCSPKTNSCTTCTYNTIKAIFGNDGINAILDHILYIGSLDGQVKILPKSYDIKQYRRSDGGQWCRTVTPTGCANDFSDHEPIMMDFELRRVTP
ncbi:MAG: endonuclease/exonuclease/phosphatase family protein [Planctomycetes bacterium]|nr:endonuclease/exonuclease/phosphatase family protein [Planctomycetota bacterium]